MTLNFKKEKNFAFSFTASVILHLIIAAAAIFYLKLTVQSKVTAPFIQLETNLVEQKNEAKEEKNENDPVITEEKNIEKKEEEKSKPETSSTYLQFTNENVDTSALEQVYKESTLNVTMKYPKGWTYIDQNVKDKLDGVTFWSSRGNYNPPPYVFLEVKEKYLFNSNRYKYNMELEDGTAYYNDPEELSGQVTQEFYIRTDSDEDFSIKLVMEGQSAFKSFQPVFFGMLKSFEFGSSLF